ncbi:MAG: hypothetical protein QOF76_661 [Solirubrobacteraceae bacterium]|nr:hypothetical protein [Solirubrobacteraceae bacterium]
MVERMRLIAEFDRLGAAQELGFRSTQHWLTVECRIDPRTSRDYVQVAKRLEVWARVRQALGGGRLSYSQCRALSRAAIEEDEAALLEVALGCTVVALEAHVRQLRSAASADLATVVAARERRSLRWDWDQDGTLRLWGRLGPVEGAAIIEALETGAANIFSVRDLGRVPLGARRADALANMALQGCPRTTLMLHADLAALASASGERRGSILHLQDGPSIPSELARRLTCDAMITLDGLNHGRTQRLVTPALRRALEARDGRKCWMPGCDCTHGLAAHHIRHWTRGGRTDLENLLLLCPYHHRLFHEGSWHMSRRRGRIHIRNTTGKLVHEAAAPVTRRHRRPTRDPHIRWISFEDLITHRGLPPAAPGDGRTARVGELPRMRR